MRFEFAAPGEILFGAGRLKEVGGRAAVLGRRALLVTGVTASRSEPLVGLLSEHEVEVARYAVQGEPTVEAVRSGVEAARDAECEVVIGFGGGSAVDAGKAIAGVLANGGDPLDYLEVIGRGRALTKPSMPYIAIPTTAGTGAEVTRNAVLASPEHRTKVSLRSPLLLARLAVVDPEVTYSMPPEVTAYTGLDALTQLIEPFVSVRANPLVDGLCREGMARAARGLRQAYACGDDAEARADMSLASLFGGLALANAGLGAVHGFAGPLGGMFAAPHGAICGRLLPHVMMGNIRALEGAQPDSPALNRYEEAACILTGSSGASVREGAEWVGELVSDLQIPPLSEHGMTAGDVSLAVAKAEKASSMKGNPVKLSAEQMGQMLLAAL